MRKCVLALLLLSITITQNLYAQTAHADDISAQGSSLQISPYVWASDIKGTISPFKYGPDIQTNKSFSDILKDLQVGGFINVWARHQDYVFLGDIMYVKLKNAKTTGPLSSLPNPIPTIPSIKGKINTTQMMVSLQGGVRLLKEQNFSLDALVGAKLWHISNKVTLQSGRHTISYREKFNWVDPVIGTRFFYRLTDKTSLQVQADIGGFNVGSKFTWSTLGSINHQFADHLVGSLGYKVLRTNYDNEGNRYDVRMKGPVIGLTYYF